MGLWFFAALALAGPRQLEGTDPRYPRLQGELAYEGSVFARQAPADDADLVVLYGGEQRGSTDTCGCIKRPRGSLMRLESYRRAHDEVHGTRALLVDVGNWLDDTIGLDGDLRLDVRVGNGWMVRGLEQQGWDALNVSFRDLPYLASRSEWPTGVVSANIQASEGTRALPTHRIVEVDGLRVALTGVSVEGMTFIQPEGYTYAHPVEALRTLVPTLRAQADFVVVLAFDAGPLATEIARLDGIDLLVEGGGFAERYDPFFENGTLWVRSHDQTMRLGEVRMALDETHRVRGAVDRKIDLDTQIPDERELARLNAMATAAIEEARATLFAEGPG